MALGSEAATYRGPAVRSRHRRALALMAGAVMFFSTNALLVELTLGDTHPFLYNAGVWSGTALGLGGILLLFYRPVFADPAIRRVLLRRVAGLKTDGVRRWDLLGMMLLMVVGRFAFALFPWATQYVETATVAILHYTWPVFFIMGLSRWDRANHRRYRRVTAFSWSGLVLAFLGMAAVVVGTLGFQAVGTTLTARVFGMVLAVVSGVLVVFTVATCYPLADGLAKEVIRKNAPAMNRDSLEFACLLFGYCVSAMVCVIPNALIGLGNGGQVTWEGIGWAVAVGFTLVPGAVLSRRAVLVTPDLGVNALVYASPVVGLLWLGLFTDINVARLDLLVLGAIVVAVANVLINRTRTHTPAVVEGPKLPITPG
ncbi:MAG: hypothetical protein OXC98_09070 [bacterium]|nr:hypothetical protein [Acidimicrobiia bacterium]MCY4650499.1 hypothetical protein [bacterium]